MTIAAAEAEALVAPSTPVPREAAQRVLDYLIFHRSLLDEPAGPPALLERYLDLVRNLKEGVHIVIPDPVQKATALLFELVMDEAFDPWEIDLVRFTQVYLERVRADGSIDFAVAGRLLYMAWSILYLQSERVLRHREAPPAPPEGAQVDVPEGAFDAEAIADVPLDPVADVTAAVLGGGDPPLVEMVRHSGTRPVSLLELVQAFGDAEVEARRSLRVQELRERLRDEQRSPPEVRVHGDIPEQDLADAWTVIARHPVGEPFPFLGLWRPALGRDRLVSLFLAVLFLAKERSVDLNEADLGRGPLLIARARDARTPPTEP